MRFTTTAVTAFAAAALACVPATAAPSQGVPGVPGNPDPAAAKPGAYKVEPYHTRVEFMVDHMGFTEWNGDFTGVSGTLSLDPAHPEASKVDIAIPVASVATTNTKLDEELKSPTWLDATQFPTIRFVSTGVTRLGPGTARLTGNLTLHGVTKPVVLAVRFHGAGTNPLDKAYTVGFDGITRIRRSDFGVMTYLPMIGDEVAIRISAAFEAQ